MKIVDLSYLENALENELIVGGAILGMEAVASATGDDTLASTSTDIRIKSIANGRGAIAKGKSSALAIGNDPYADTSYYADGFDKIIVKERSGKGKNFAFDSTKVMAIDLPNK